MNKLINRKVLISMIFIGLTMMGLFSYRYLLMELYPDAEFPSLNVTISTKTELDPKYIESQAAIPVEGVISGLEGVEDITTLISNRNARITVSFTKNTNVKYAYLKLEEKIKAITKSIPEDFTIQVNKAGSGMASDQFMTLQILGDEFAGVNVAEETSVYPQVKAGSKITVKGRILTPEGALAEDFTGTVHPTVLDSKEEVTTLDNRDEGAFTYTERSKTLFSGSDSVRQGRFEFTFPVPLDINYSDEEGLLSLYALDAVHSHEAGGAFDRFLVGGTDDGVSLTDTLGPKITVYLNTPDFSPGGQTNTTPLFVAELEDADGINTVGNGIGHDLSLCIDGSAVLTYNLNDYYTPVAGDYTRGTVYFSVPELTEGKHTLSFRAWDLLNNSSTKTLEFEVVRGLRPGLFSVICTQSPARESTTFVLSHNRPGSTLAVRMSVYDFAGREMWTHLEKGVSEGQTYYVEWDLCSNGGQRLAPGVYLYRASIVSDGSRESTKSQKIIILSQ